MLPPEICVRIVIGDYLKPELPQECVYEHFVGHTRRVFQPYFCACCDHVCLAGERHAANRLSGTCRVEEMPEPLVDVIDFDSTQLPFELGDIRFRVAQIEALKLPALAEEGQSRVLGGETHSMDAEFRAKAKCA